MEAKILMATDGSVGATAALRAAARLLNNSASRVDLLWVVPTFRLPIGQESFRWIADSYYGRMAAETERILEEAADILRAEGIQPKARLAKSQRVEQRGGVQAGQRDQAARGEGDVFRGDCKIARRLNSFGSTTERVVRQASGPVLVVPANACNKGKVDRKEGL